MPTTRPTGDDRADGCGEPLERLKDIWEFYELLRCIENRLDEAGESDWAERLRNAVLGGATGGEILDRVGVEFRHLQDTEVPVSSGVANDVLVADQFIAAMMDPHP